MPVVKVTRGAVKPSWGRLAGKRYFSGGALLPHRGQAPVGGVWVDMTAVKGALGEFRLKFPRTLRALMTRS
jgi:hypothetical protein